MRRRILFVPLAMSILWAGTALSQVEESPSVVSMVPVGLKVDEHASGTTVSNVNKVFQPGEDVLFEPAWMNNTAGTINNLHGTGVSFTGPTGATYGFLNPVPNGADYGSPAAAATTNCYDATAGHTCYELSVLPTASRPVQHWDATFTETLTTGDTKAWSVHIGDSFSDVSNTSGIYRFIETIFHKGITSGCGGTSFCPNSSVTRQQIAVFLMLAEHGSSYTPPACTTATFTDMPCTSGFAPWVYELVAESVTAGCAPSMFCPGGSVNRAQMAVFLLRSHDGPTYTPPACTVPTFSDVPCSSPFAIWIDELAARGIAAGCGSGNYCPANLVTRGQMAVFLTTTFALNLYGT